MTTLDEIKQMDDEKKAIRDLGGSLLPMCVYDDKEENIIETTVVTSMSGGAEEIEGVPKNLILLRSKEGVDKYAKYILVEESIHSEATYV